MKNYLLANKPSGADNNIYGSELVSWLRSSTDDSGTHNDKFRVRDSLLGDIVNSSPVFVGQKHLPFNQYSGLEGSKYTTFINHADYTGRTNAVYVGANDGMLHAFNADTGTEMFAYVPHSVFPNLAGLAASDYNSNHKYTVDGKLTVFPAYVNNDWKTVLVGTPGAGGRSVFALNVSKPQSFDSGGDDVLWEVTDADMGYSLGEASIVRLNDGKWYAAVANGYYSDNFTAMLLLIDLDDGSITKIATNNGSASNPNGLSPPNPVDLDGNQTVDIIYAGDYRGNLWRFDLRNASNSNWSADLLFSATALNTGNEQHISVKPEVSAHPDGGVMVYFGTGKFFETGDATLPNSPEFETFYAIRDNTLVIDSSDTDNTNRDRSDLQAQTITEQELNASTNTNNKTRNVRVVSSNAVNYSSVSGWYIDLKLASATTGDGERVINTAHIRKGRIEFSVVVPGTAKVCTNGSKSWLYSLDSITGNNPTSSIFDLNGDGVIDSGDLVTVDGQLVAVSVIGYDGMMGEVTTVTNPGNDFILTPDGDPLAGTGGYNQGRQSWRRIR